MTRAGDSDALEIALDRGADVPLGVQLAWALRTRILDGALGPGDRLPALHRLAAEVGLNANTVRAVYQRLEQEGLVATRHGSGTFVLGGGAEQGALAQLAGDAARAARAAGVDPREVAAALYMDSEPVVRRDPEVAERRRLRAQIATLEQALAELTAGRAAHTPPVAARQSALTPRPHLPGAAELTRERDELLRRLAEAHPERTSPSVDPPPARRRAPSRAPKLRPAPRAT
jgi:DNA-binding transcriptional regulator YhcF (GntR family)